MKKICGISWSNATRYLVAFLAVGTLLFVDTAPVLADLSPDDVDSIYNNWPEWVVGDNLTCSTVESSGPLEGKDNIAKAFNFFVKNGLTAAQAAGVLGNLRQESGVSPASPNTAAKPSSIRPDSIIPGETWYGGGIAQWEDTNGVPGRWTGSKGFLNYVAGKGVFAGHPQGDGHTWKDLGIQLNYIWWELNNTEKGTLDAVKSASTVDQATIKFEENYERAGQPNMPRRIRLANEVFSMLGNTVPGTIPPGGDDSFGCAASGGLVDVNGYSFPLSPRTKKDYGTLPCRHPVMDGAYTRNGRYTDRYGNVAQIRTCHHDGTPAFDLMDGNGGSPVYAITNGTIVNVDTCYSMTGPCEAGCMAIQFHANNGNDKNFYWYGHLQNALVHPGQAVVAGQQIASTATRARFDSRCWGGGPHLHIDRGCVNRQGTPQHGGNGDCREPKFLDDLAKIWEALPK